MIRLQIAAALLAVIFPVFPAAPQPADHRQEQASPSLPRILPLRERAELQDAWLARRLDTLVPALMREAGVDMWVLVAREYLEDPVMATMLNATSMHARRRTILVFHDPGGGRPVERLTVSRYGIGGLFAPAWNPEEQPDQWARLSALIAARDPRVIRVNVSPASAFGDGLTHSQYQALVEALPPRLRRRVAPGDDLAINWLQTRIPEEMARYPEIVRISHAIIAEGFSPRVVRPGHSTAADVAWWLRERVSALSLDVWFHPSVAIFRAGSAGPLDGDTIIQPGDMLWCDFGITYLGLNTDIQHLAYVLRPGERDAPPGLRAGLAAANRAQDSVTASFRMGLSGNEVLAAARTRTAAPWLAATIYSHPLGYHGHGAGPSVGFWDNQDADPRGTGTVRANTAWSIELNVRRPVHEWDGQIVEFRLEEDAYFDGSTVRYLDGRQDRFHLIGR